MSEYFDVYDKNRNSLGYTKERGSELLDNEFNMGAECFIICNNKILMTQRCSNKSHAGEWEAPGGCSQAGESSIDTLVRELKEEINYIVDPNKTKLIGTKIYKKMFVDIYQIVTDINLDDIKIQEEEVSDFKLVSKEEFDQLNIVASELDRFNYIKDKLDLNW